MGKTVDSGEPELPENDHWWKPQPISLRILTVLAAAVGLVAAIFQFLEPSQGGGWKTFAESAVIAAIAALLVLFVPKWRRAAIVGVTALIVAAAIGWGGYAIGVANRDNETSGRSGSSSTSTPTVTASTSSQASTTPGPSSSVDKVAALNPDDPTRFAALSVNGVLSTWRLDKPGVEQHHAPDDTKTVRALAIDKLTTNTLAVGLGDGSVQIWDESNLSGPLRSGPGKGAVTALAFDPSAKNTLVVGRENGTLEVWDPSSAKPTTTRGTACGGGSAVSALALDPTTPNTLISACADGTLQAWDRTSLGQPVPPAAQAANGHGQISALALDPSVKNSLAIGYTDGFVEIRDRTKLATSARTSSGGRQSPVLALAFDRNVLFAVLADRTGERWDATVLGKPLQ